MRAGNRAPRRDLDVHVAVDRTQDPGPQGRGGARMQRTNAVEAARAAGGERARNADGMEALNPGGSGSSQTDNLVNTLHLAQMLAF